MLQNSFHQNWTISAREHQMDSKTEVLSSVQTPGKTASVFLSTLIYGYKVVATTSGLARPQEGYDASLYDG